MCGRFTLAKPPRGWAARFGVDPAQADEIEADFKPSWNVAPTQHVLAVRAGRDGPSRELVRLRWGLIPYWAADPTISRRLLNARAETAAEMPAFRDAFRWRRCIVPADGFYEWRRGAGQKSSEPFHLRAHDGSVFAIAGLWERWRPKDAPDIELTESCTLLTTAANAAVSPLHDRMPVILDDAAAKRWLDAEQSDPAALRALLRPSPDEALQAHAVCLRVNDVRADDEGLLAPA